jgi:shikimate 5-dehydrogenase
MLDHLSGATRLFPIIGDPIRYVEPPMRLTRTFGARGHDGVCVPMQVPGPALDDVMRGLSATPNVDGLLVTMPHKRAAVSHCATASERATLLGAVSVLRRNSDGTWHGDMLDGPSDPTGCDLVCNATPLGMAEGDPLPLDADLLTSSMFVGDVIAGHGLTPLLAAAEAVGCRTANGGQMVEAVQELMVDFMV